MKLCLIILIIVIHGIVSQPTPNDENACKLAAITDFVCNDDTSPITNVQKGEQGPKGSNVISMILFFHIFSMLF